MRALNSPSEPSKAQTALTTFSPSSAQREAKAAFLVATRDLPPSDSYSLARVKQLLPRQAGLDGWWEVPGFKEWLTYSQEFAITAELATWEAMNTCREIMSNSEEKGAARVNAAKLVFEIAGKFQRQQSSPVADKFINSMDKEQLADFIKKHVALLPEAADVQKAKN